jgi:hypothetical protein
MKYKLTPLALALIPAFACATDWYFVDCGANAAAACAANVGAEANAGTSSGAPKQLSATVKTKFNALAAGETIYLSRGAAWDATALTNLANINCTATSRCTIRDFTPSWLANTDSGSGGTVTYGASTLTDSSKTWTVNAWVGYEATVLDSRGAPQYCLITANTATALTLASCSGGAGGWKAQPTDGTAYSLAGQRPILNNTTAGGMAISFTTSGGTVPHAGYTVQNIRIQGNNAGASSRGIFVFKDADYLTIDGVSIDGFSTAFYSNSSDNGSHTGGDGLSLHHILRKSTFTNNNSIGIETSSPDTLIENDFFANNSSSGGDHHIYLDDQTLGSGGTASSPSGDQYIVRHNTMIDNSFSAANCTSVAVVVHGRKDNVFIEDNYIKETTATTSSNCWGISVDSGAYGGVYANEGFNNVRIRGNTVIGYGTSIGLDITNIGTIENNYISSGFASGAWGISVRSKNFSPTINSGNCSLSTICSNHIQPNKIKVRNNTVALSAPNGSSVGIRLNANVGDAVTGSGFELANNIVYFGSGSSSSTACFDTQNVAVAKYTYVDRNLCFYSATAGKWDNARSTLAADQAVGFNANSLTTDPTLTSVYTSPAVNAGSPVIGAGSVTYGSTFTYGGKLRGGSPDIGADQRGSSGIVPSPPTRIQVQ